MATRIRRINVTKGGNNKNTMTTRRTSRSNKGRSQADRASSGEEDSEADESVAELVSDDDEEEEDDEDESDMSDLSEETPSNSDLSETDDGGEENDEEGVEGKSEDDESLLGSADSEEMGSDLEEEEERFIIEDLARRREKVEARRKKTGQGITPKEQQAIAEALNGNDEDSMQADPFPDDVSGSLSPETMHQLGLDELLEGPDGFNSSSEPSFTDFFGSESEDGTEDGIMLEARSDDQQLTTDDEDSETDISDLEDGLLSAPFLNEALAAGAGTQLTPGGEQNTQADVPLLVIEDLDGRLIYARAGDGEAVFGSDGEFEFVDDSEDDSGYDTDELDEDDIPFHMDGVYHRGRQGWNRRMSSSGHRWRHRLNDNDDDETDEGDTTDELPNEDMPFPRLLVGSVAPHGGRNARRARALAAQSRRISPNGANPMDGQRRKRSASGVSHSTVDGAAMAKQAATSFLKDVDFSISTEELARDPQATLEAAAQQLGLTVDEVAQLVIGIKTGGEGAEEAEQEQRQSLLANGMANLTPTLGNNRALPSVVTPENRRRGAPQMGSFMPTSSKSVHRAVIDGSRQAPSPFASRYGTQKKGLAARKRHHSSGTPSAKRARRDESHQHFIDATSEAETDNAGVLRPSELSPSDEHQMDVDSMRLDDVMDGSLLWRNSYPSSPPSMPNEGSATNANGGLDGKSGSAGKKSPSVRASSRRSPGASSTGSGGRIGAGANKSPGGGGGLNLNAVARWHRVSMNAFRQSQEAHSTARQQPLGMFLLTRSRNGQGNKAGRGSGVAGNGRAGNVDHSPFRGRARGASIHLNEAPKHVSRDSFMVSPVLWPTRHGADNTTSAAQASGAHLFLNKGQSTNANDSSSYQSGHETQNARKMMTRREKRERKARKAALKAALRGNLETQVVDSEMVGANPPLPEGFLPHFDITQPSPVPSPLADSSSGSSEAVKVSATDGGKSASSRPIDIPSAGVHKTSAGSGHNAPDGQTHELQGAMLGNSVASNASSSLSSQHQPPSSVFGMPLHSPLFSSILNPPNLGFRDDLDEQTDEGILTI